ncbi:MAG: SH3 domain-containing protein [Saprospiraceae bacterium]
MKKITVLIAVLFALQSALCNTDPDTTTPLSKQFVTANSGLCLRNQPRSNATQITVIPFGAAVEILPDTLTYGEETVSYVKGQWKKVRYENQTGYVFDGFLAAYELPVNQFTFPSSYYLSDIMYTWAFKNFKTQNFTVEKFANDFMTQYSKTFENGVASITYTDKNQILELSFFDDSRIFDVYHIVRSILLNKEDQENFDLHNIVIKNKEGEVSKIRNDAFGKIEITNLKNGGVKLSISENQSFR